MKAIKEFFENLGVFLLIALACIGGLIALAVMNPFFWVAVAVMVVALSL